MALSRAAFQIKYTDVSGSGIFRDAKPIIAADEREFANDIAESVVFPETSNATMWKADLVHLKTTAALPPYTVTFEADGITPRLTANSNGSFPSTDGQGPFETYIISEETPANNGVYYLAIPGDGFSPWVLIMRSDSVPASWASDPIYYVKFGDTQAGRFYKQVYDGVGRTFVDMPGLNKRRVKATLTTSQILSANSSPVQLLAPQGAGSFIKLTSPAIVKYKYGSAAFATNTSIVLSYGTASGFTVGNTALISNTANALAILENTQPNSSLAPAWENAGIYFLIQTGNPTAGTGSTIVIEFEYEVIYL